MTYKFIRSTAFADCYLSMDARGLTSFQKGGGGRVNCQDTGSHWEYLQVVNLTGANSGQVAFKSTATAFKNIYLRMYCPDNQVNCQFSQGDLERFWIRSQPDGKVAIESVAYPGNYLTMNGKADRNGSGYGFVSCAQWVKSWEKFELADLPNKLTAKEMREVIGKYGPQLRLTPNENYLPCTVEWLLANSTLKSKSHGQIVHPNINDLPTKKEGEQEYWLDIEKPGTYGDLGGAKAYVHARMPSISTYTDLQFWFCYGFNGPAKLYLTVLNVIDIVKHSVSPLGEHYGDWECCMLRIDNVKKTIVGAWLSQHSGGQFFNKFDIPSIAKFGSQPIVYASNNGHAVYSRVGDNFNRFFEKGWWIFNIRGEGYNTTSDGGPQLDCSRNYEIVSADWLSNDFPRAIWLSYPYRWGPTGSTPYDLNPIINGILKLLPGAVTNAPGTREIVAELVRAFQVAIYNDNIDGPEGPAFKDQWVGKYD